MKQDIHVKWGKIVSGFSQVEQAVSDGFDFVQPVNDFFLRLTGEQLNIQNKRIENGGVPFTVCEIPLPADVRISQRGFNIYVWIEHLKDTAHRMAALGCKKLIWSNGRARVLPIEGDIGGFKEQIRQFLYLLCETLFDLDITVLVKPLGPERTNFLNNMSEMADFLSLVQMENLSSMICLSELDQIGLTLDTLPDFKKYIGHVELDNPHIPSGKPADPVLKYDAVYRPFLQKIKEMGYSEEITLPNDADFLMYCRQLWNE